MISDTKTFAKRHAAIERVAHTISVEPMSLTSIRFYINSLTDSEITNSIDYLHRYGRIEAVDGFLNGDPRYYQSAKPAQHVLAYPTCDVRRLILMGAYLWGPLGIDELGKALGFYWPDIADVASRMPALSIRNEVVYVRAGGKL